MVILDSVFSQYTGYFPKDKTITPARAIALDLNLIESSAIKSFSQTFDKAVKNAVDSLTAAIASGDQNKVKSYKWGLSLGLSNNLYGEWLLGWKSGRETGSKEIGTIKEGTSNFSLNAPSLCLKPTIEFNQPAPESDILRNRPAESAIKARVNTLARDVSDSEWEEIKGDILDAIQPQSRTENPISRKELLERINEKLGDRKNRFKDRAETIARTELTFAYNAGRLDSYVRSGLVAGVRFSTIFDERRCPLCASRQGIVVSLDDVEGLARLAIPVHPRCRCVWSPVLKTQFEEISNQPGRQIKDRKLVPAKTWLIGGILAAILIPEELFAAGLLLSGLRALIAKAGSAKLARAAIANTINTIGTIKKGTSHQALERGETVGGSLRPLNVPFYSLVPNIITPGIDLNTATPKQLRSLIPNLTDAQIYQIVNNRPDLSKLSTIVDKNQWATIRAIARDNYILNILHSQNNLTPSALWVNSGGIIPKNKANIILKEIKKGISSKEDLIELMKKNKIDYKKLINYSDNIFNREYPIK